MSPQSESVQPKSTETHVGTPLNISNISDSSNGSTVGNHGPSSHFTPAVVVQMSTTTSGVHTASSTFTENGTVKEPLAHSRSSVVHVPGIQPGRHSSDLKLGCDNILILPAKVSAGMIVIVLVGMVYMYVPINIY